ncbi:hypothetical protein YG5714_1644 [Sulfolobus islandicus Y.G.57.14]|jgi:hypothetical protein|uniref:Uncharacterized protein n=2 Tax=Saccharolobus islandicus TaxID=43080 RepID=C3N6R1_SACI7|nr:hypothetical protein [Sulfolobus islandicus]ACP45905.1 hypothetical protein YG5714_1644 [Sulfolobus islandicus Y.G.57.14]ACP50092.1 hypothetical protein YN1551_3221 [Sulfolobus islandicus Y.N.15.51]
MAKVEEGEIILDTEEEVNNLIEAIRKEKVDEELIKKALLLSKKSLVSNL